MRLVTWNCSMALHRKAEALVALKPDIAVICECAAPETLRLRGEMPWIEAEPVWVGDNRNKGLGVFTFNGFSARLDDAHLRTLRYVAPVQIDGPLRFKLLAVWAQNASAGTTRKHQLGPLRRSLGTYKGFLADDEVVIAGDFNNNVIWDKPGWRMNHMTMVTILARMGLISAYHALRSEDHGRETEPTHYWRDRRKDGPTYHIDYVFLPEAWLAAVRSFTVGSFEDWCGSGLSDHVPLVMDLEL